MPVVVNHEEQFQRLRARLDRVGQSHLLHFYSTLDPSSQKALLDRLGAIDLEALPALIEGYVRHKPAFVLPADVAPAPFYPNDPSSPRRPWNRDAARLAGESLIRAGKVAAFVVAGGQGSRLGFEGPKGCFPAGAVTGKSLFAFFADNLLAARDRFGVRVPWYIMTSPQNDGATRAFFKEHHFFGLDPRDVMFFPQGVLPSLDIVTGKVLMASPSEPATNPDGHGGSIKALHVSGALSDMTKRGIEQISYFQVDNPCVRVLDPVFLGLHAAAPDSSAEMSSKMLSKAYPEEKLGVFCQSKGRVEVIEYSDLPMELQRERLPDGSLRFVAGSIAIHIMSVRFVERLATDPNFSLPYHRAEKKIPCIDPETGAAINPTGNNGVKLERFVFDALPMCQKSIVFETDRVEEFAPIKNATGVDSVESSREIQTQRAARWLEKVGVKVARAADGRPDCVIELSPRTAMCAEDLNGRDLPRVVKSGERISL
jgi:UDP-N-acetylglucosamine/UDP-N-acetylgalactosamine diphosphorylase